MNSETLDLARLQFAVTAGVHFLFVALTLGLATIVACLQTRATFGNSPLHVKMTRFWGQLYLVNYAVGIVTGLVMEFQFGLNWSGLMHFAGNAFGASLAMETLVAFFLESTFLGLWIFGWGRLNRWVHLMLIWGVALTAYASAYWILVSNGMLQNPVGVATTDHGLRIDDAVAMVTNPNSLAAFWHIAGGAMVTAGFFLAGVSGYHLFRRTADRAFFVASLRVGTFVALPSLMFLVVPGGLQFAAMTEAQPMKLAVFSGQDADIARLQADMVARFGPGDYVPPEVWVRTSGVLMVLAYVAMFLLSGASFLLALIRPVVVHFRLWHLVLVAAVPLPYIAMISGWIFREMGRQPWVIQGLLRVEDAVSRVPPAQMRTSLLLFGVLFGLLALVDVWLLVRIARQGPDAVELGRPESERSTPAPPVPTF